MLDEDIVYDELRRREDRDGWQPEALRLPLRSPRHEDEEAHTEESDDESSDRGVIIIDMNDGYSIVD